MDELKKSTVKDYTAWDLNAKCARIKNRQKIESLFKRKARRKNRQDLKKVLDKHSTKCYN